MKFIDKIKELLNIKQPIIHIRSELEKECIISILNITENEDIELYSYDPLNFIGLEKLSISEKDVRKEKVFDSDEYDSEIEINSPSRLKDFFDKDKETRTVVLLNDFQILSNTSPMYNRLIRIYAERRLSERNITFIVLSNNFEIPKELEHLTFVVDYDNPNEEDIKEFLEEYGLVNNVSEFDDEENIVKLAKKLVGFNYNEILAMLNRSMNRFKKIDLKVIEEERLQEITKTSILNIKKADKTLDDVGGNGRFKDYIKEIEMCKTDEAKELGLTPKGHLALGIAGSAKTFTAEALAASWKVPFIKLELNKILSKFAGESEKNMAKALELVRSCAPCVCLIDEVEKVLGGK